MAKNKNKYAMRLEKENEKISKIAKIILIAFCVQFILYIGFINIVPFSVDKNGNGATEYSEINSSYYETWDGLGSYKINGESVYIDNGIKFIYYYNVILLIAIAVLCMYYAILFMERYEGKIGKTIKQFFKENKGLLFLLLFMVWTFISCIFAKDLFRSFVGCYNLRDGYISFMFYGSILICMLLLNKNDNKAKDLILNLFVISTMVVAILTLANYYITDFPIGIKIIPIESNSGVFNNSNHYGYLLSIITIALAAMSVKSKKIVSRILYAVSFIVMSWMLILNNTFGAYIGVSVSLFFMLVYEIIVFILNKSNKLENNDEGIKKGINLITTFVIAVCFLVLSCNIKNTEGNIIVKANIDGILDDVKKITSSVSTENVESGEAIDTEVVSGEEITSTTTTSEEDTDEAGSGRWRLWVGACEIIKKRPILGWGLENMKAEYISIGIGEGRSHSLIFQLAGTTGIVGLLLYLSGIIYIFFRNLKNFKTWDKYTYIGMFVIISYMISSLVGNSAFYTSGYFYIFVAFAAVSATKKIEDKK